jgi:hypothetical protein
MRKLTAVVVLALLGFYVGWPLWTGYRISQAFQSQDAALLATKVDFASVRASLRPVVANEVAGSIERARRDAGPLGGLIQGQLKDDLLARLVESALATAVTPDNVIRIVRQGGNLRQAFERIMLEQVGRGAGAPGAGGGDAGSVRVPGGIAGLPGLGTIPGLPRRPGGSGQEPQKSAEPARPAGDEKPSFGLGNIKRFGFSGPLGYVIGVARDPASSEPDVTAELAFTGFDWKVVRIIPRLDR